MARSERGRSFGERSTTEGDPASVWPRTWRSIRDYMDAKYLGSYQPGELRAMEIKWRKIFVSVGWSVKGQ